MKFNAKISSTDYENSISRTVDEIKKQNPVAIYRLGRVGSPGISDIDLLVILNDEIKGDFTFSYRNMTNSIDRYLFIHEIFLIPISIASQFRVLLPTDNLQLVYGHGIKFDTPTKEDQLAFIAHLMSGIYYEWPFRANINSNNLREQLATLSAAKWTYHCVLPFAKKNFQEYTNLVEDIDGLRLRARSMNEFEIIKESIFIQKKIQQMHLKAFEIITLKIKENYQYKNKLSVYFSGVGPNMTFYVFSKIFSDKRYSLGRLIFLPIEYEAIYKPNKEYKRYVLMKKLEQWLENNNLNNYQIGIMLLVSRKKIKTMIENLITKYKK